MSNAACADGHYVCDTCHSKKGIEAVKEICLHSKSKNPYEIAVQMMETPFIHMHGPENHVLVGAALLAAYKNAGGDIELDTVIEEMKNAAVRCREVHAAFGDAAVQQSAPGSLSVSSQVPHL